MQPIMYCPRCSNEYGEGTVYCRKCGLALDEVTKILTGEADSAPEMISRPNWKVMRIGIGLFIFGSVIALANGALSDFDLFPQAYGNLVFLAIVAAGMLMLGAGFLFPKKQFKKRKPAINSQRDVKLDTAPLQEKLNPGAVDDIVFPKKPRELDPIAVGSVTENTTRNLNRN